MKVLIFISVILASGISLAGSPSSLPEKIFEIPELGREESVRNLDSLISEAKVLNSVIGHYPPAYTSEEQRDKTYALWSDLLLDANAFPRDSESSLFLNAQLYRQGHNMDVRYAAQKSDEYIQSCISAYKQSERCHLEATYLYLQVGPPNIKLAKKSLKALKRMYKPKLSEEVEAGYVFVYLYSRDNKGAIKQINKYLKEFPHANRAEMFKNILAGIKDSGIQVKSN
jgi:hypothetical protein